MELHRQTCQACGSREHQNLLCREPGHADVVYVRCARCGELVARYALSGYYHHGKGVESYLRSVQGPVESGRRILEEFEAARHEALEGFARALHELEGKQS